LTRNMKIVCIFSKVFSKKPNPHKTWKPFFWGGFFKDLWSIFVFLSEVFEFNIYCFPTMENVGSLNIQHSMP
jgi:hypothetical protein